MSSEDHWKWRQRNPSEFLLKTAKSQAFQIFLWTDVANSLPCSFLNWVKTTWSSRELNFRLLTLKIAFNVLNSASPQKSSPLGRQLPHLNGVHERVLTFTTEVTFSSLMGETARHARSAACWGGRKGRQWGAWDRNSTRSASSCRLLHSKGVWRDGEEKMTGCCQCACFVQLTGMPRYTLKAWENLYLLKTWIEKCTSVKMILLPVNYLVFSISPFIW